MKYLILILSILITSMCNGYSQTKTIYNSDGILKRDTIPRYYDSLLNVNKHVEYYHPEEIMIQWYDDTIPVHETTHDTIPVIMQVSDTGYLYNGLRDTKVYWIKGYKVIGNYDTYYLDILKQPLRKSVIVWLDQNL